MNNLERKLSETPFRTPPPAWRAEILPDAAPAPAVSTPDAMPFLFAWLFRRKTFPTLAFLLCILATAGAFGVLIVKVSTRSEWDAYTASARERGVKMTLSDLIPAPIPDEENFAAVPPFSTILSDDEKVREQAAKSLSLPASPKSATLSTPASPQLLDLAAWQAAFVESKDLPAAGADPADDVLRAIQSRLGPGLAQLALAESRLNSNFPVKWERGFAALLPHLSLLQSSAKIHRLRMAAHLAKGDSAAALADFRGGVRLYHALAQEPILISGLVRISILGMTLPGVWEGIVRGAWTDADLAQIEASLADLDLLADYRFALSGERAGLNDICEQLLRGEKQAISALTQGIGLDGTPQTIFIYHYVPYIPGYVRLNQLAINRYHDSQLAALAPATDRRSGVVSEYDPAVFKSRSSGVRNAFYSLYLTTAPALGTVEKSYLYNHSMLQMTRLACALERARLATGAYPESLDALVPSYLSTIPHDVIDGQPLRYRRTADGHFLLYSVGMNSTDDGGTTGPAKNPRDGDDWLWRWPE